MATLHNIRAQLYDNVLTEDPAYAQTQSAYRRQQAENRRRRSSQRHLLCPSAIGRTHPGRGFGYCEQQSFRADYFDSRSGRRGIHPGNHDTVWRQQSAIAQSAAHSGVRAHADGGVVYTPGVYGRIRYPYKRLYDDRIRAYTMSVYERIRWAYKKENFYLLIINGLS